MNVLIDSNIIIYSLTEQSPKKKASQKFIRNNQHILCISHQVILESLRVLTHPGFKHPMNYKKALKSVWSIVDVLNLISPNINTIILVKELIKKYKVKSNRIFDAYLIATALSSSVSIIATDNIKHFRTYEEIKVLNPFEDM